MLYNLIDRIKFLLLFCLLLSSFKKNTYKNTEQTIARCIDGDTIVLSNGIIVRVLGLDTFKVKKTNRLKNSL